MGARVAMDWSARRMEGGLGEDGAGRARLCSGRWTGATACRAAAHDEKRRRGSSRQEDGIARDAREAGMRGPTGAAEEKSVVSGETEEKQIAGGVERGRKEPATPTRVSANG